MFDNLKAMFKKERRSTFMLLHNGVIITYFFEVVKMDSGDLCVRARELGLTAYGKTEKEAAVKLYNMAKTWVDLNLKDNTLESSLNHSGLDWHYNRD